MKYLPILMVFLIFVPSLVSAQIQMPNSNTINQVVNSTQGIATGITQNSGLTPTNNPFHIDSSQLTQITNAWFNTLKQLIGFGESIHNSTAVSASIFSGGRVSYQVVWIIGIILTTIVIIGVLYAFAKGLMRLIFVLLGIVIILMEYRILTA